MFLMFLNGYSRDIKSDNVFLTGQGRFVIGDLGHVLVLSSESNEIDFEIPADESFQTGGSTTDEMISPVKISHEHSVANVGTPLYNAPELKNSNLLKADYDPEKVDVWAVGLILFMLLTSSCPWSLTGLNCELLERNTVDGNEIVNNQFWSKWNSVKIFRGGATLEENIRFYGDICPEAKLLINRLCSYDPCHRPSFQELEDAMWGRNNDRSLSWIASTDVCTINELFLELQGRTPKIQRTFVRYVDSKKLWNKVRILACSVKSFKGKSASPPVSDLKGATTEVEAAAAGELPLRSKSANNGNEAGDAATKGSDFPLTQLSLLSIQTHLNPPGHSAPTSDLQDVRHSIEIGEDGPIVESLGALALDTSRHSDDDTTIATELKGLSRVPSALSRAGSASLCCRLITS